MKNKQTNWLNKRLIYWIQLKFHEILIKSKELALSK